MSIVVTNQMAQPALRGQSVRIILNASDQAKLPTISVGMKAVISSSSKIGYVSSVDLYGDSFLVDTGAPDSYFESSSTPGQLAVSETITLT